MSSIPYYCVSFCCEQRCLRVPRSLVDGKLTCGCYHWCKCACIKRAFGPNCFCGFPIFERDSTTGELRVCDGKKRLVYELQCGHFYCVSCVKLYPYCNVCNKHITSFHLYNNIPNHP
nr:MAG: hypothetical protein AmFV_00084 [Apis mellifera filamentous virus]WOK43192.1 MAG: hypothetical protein [Apis mellifera filamentous virus]WOK43492.1 MAG: hypothetical protein [Apis mellifera filamentous virus]WOK43725.1 MAG: hypothetical protein [Apis mellifera filamentous virus]